MVPDNPCESYAMLVRESMQFDIPTPSRRIEIIRELPQPAVQCCAHHHWHPTLRQNVLSFPENS